MGGQTYNPTDWANVKSKNAGRSTQQIYTKRGIDAELDPNNISIRESCDSAVNPNSTPIAVFLDVTGSMGEMAGIIARSGLGTIMKETVDRKPITDPHFLMGAFGDLLTDKAPLQVTQFEGGVNEMVPQLEKLYIEGNGGGNNGESPDLAWYFMATKARIDSYLKRQKKGFLFTISDEPPPHGLRKDLLADKLGMNIERDLTPAEVLGMAQRQWECFHIFLEQGRYGHSLPAWQALMPERVIVAPDYTLLAELIVSTLQIHAGEDITTVANSWSGDTSLVIANAMKGIIPGSKTDHGGVVRL